MIVKEVLNHAYTKHNQETKRNPQAKLDQMKLLSSYEFVLKQYGLDPLTDSYFYKLLMKLENYKGDLFAALESEIRQTQMHSEAIIHYQKCLQAKTFFTLVQNMVTSQILVLEGGLQKVEKDNQPLKKQLKKRKSSENHNKENIKNGSSGRLTNRKKSNQPPLNEVQINNINKVVDEYQVIQYQYNDNKKNMTLQKPLNVQRNQTINSSKDFQQYTQQNSQKHLLQNKINQFEQSSSDYNFMPKHLTQTTQNSDRQSSRIMNQSQSMSALYHNTQKQVTRESQSSLTVKAKDYKLLLKSLRLWKQYTKFERKMKAYEEKSLESWVLSIHYYEQTLITKAFLSIQRNMYKEQNQKKGDRITKRVINVKTKQRFMSIWIKRYKIVSHRRNLMFKALNHWGSKVQHKVLQRFKHYLMMDKHTRLVTLDKYLERSSVTFYLIAVINSKSLLGQNSLRQFLDLKTQSRFKDFIPYIINSVNKYYLQKTFNNLKVQRNLGQQQSRNARKFLKKQNLKKLKSVVQKQIQIKRNHEALSFNHNQRKVWSSFAQWLGRTNNKIVKRQNNERAQTFNERNLQYKSLQAFLIYLDTKQQIQSQLKQSVNTSLSKLIKQTFQAWKFVSVYNRKNRSLMRQGRKIQTYGLKSHYFMIWIKTAISVCKARINDDKRLKLKVIQSFQRFIELKENKEFQLNQTQESSNMKIMRGVVDTWKKYTAKSQTERNLKRTIFRFLQQVRQRQVLQGWKNQAKSNKTKNKLIDKSQSVIQEKLINQVFNTLKTFSLKQKCLRSKKSQLEEYLVQRKQSQVLFTWLCLFNTKLTLRTKHKQVAINHIKNLMHDYLNNWINLTSNQSLKRNHFYRGRALNLISHSFQALKSYTHNRNQFKIRLHEFLKTRANNLQFKALSLIYSFTKQNEIQRKLRKVSAFIFLEKTLRKHFTQFKAQWQLSKQAKVVKNIVSINMVKNYVKQWKTAYMRQDIVKRFQLSQDKKYLLRTMSKLTSYTQKQKHRELKINKSLKLYAGRLQAQSLVAMKYNVQIKLSKTLRLNKAYEIYLSNISRKCLSYWYGFTDIQSQKRNLAKAIHRKNQLLLQSQILNFMRYYAQRQIGLRYLSNPLVNNRNRKTLRSCLVSLYKYSFEKSILKANYERHSQDKNNQTKLKVLDALFRYRLYSKYVKDLKVKSQDFMVLRLYRKSFFLLIKNKLQQVYTRNVLHQSSLNIASKFLQRWINVFNDQQKLRPLEDIANLQILKKAFTTFCYKVQTQIKKRQINQNYQDRAIDFYEGRNKQKAISKLLENSQTKKLQKMKFDLANKIFVKKVFNRWKYNLVQIHKDKTQHLLVKNFSAYQLQKKAFNHLVWGIQISLNQVRKCYDMENRKNQKLMRKCFYRLAQNVQTQSMMVESLRDKMRVVDRILIRPKFQQWKIFVNETFKDEKAKLFRVKRGSQYLLRKYFDQLRINNLERKQHQIIKERIYQRHQVYLKEKYFSRFISKATQSFIIKKRVIGYNQIQTHKKLNLYFQSMIDIINLQRISNYNNQKAMSYAQSNLLKKTFISLQRNHCFGQLYNIIAYKNKQKTLYLNLQQWKKSFLQSQALSHIVNTLQTNQTQKMKQVFFQRLVKLCFYQQIFETLQNNRLLSYAKTFVDLLKRNMYFSQIVFSFNMARTQISKKQVWDALSINRDIQKHKQTHMISQLKIVIEETNNEQLRSCFETLKQNTQKQRIQKQALSVYGYRLKRKAFNSLQIIGIKQQNQYYAFTQIRMKHTLKYFCYWLQAFQKQQQDNLLAQVHINNVLANIVNEWREHTQKQKAARYFHTMKLNQTTIPLAFQVLRLHSQRQRYLRHCEQEIMSNNIFQNVKNVMLNWMEYHNLKKISLNMKRFHGFKLLKSVIDEWHLVTEDNNRERAIIRDLQENFYDRPYLVKPLLVIRNVCMYKAFQALKIGTKISNESIVHRNNSLYIFYMRLMRKSFYSIKLYISKRQQNKKLRLLRNHFIIRRWFQFYRLAIENKKSEKKRRRESAIFKVLNIQRKAFNMLLQYASERQQSRIKIQFAEELYYKRLADMVLISLKINVSEARQDKESLILSGQHTLQNCDVTMGFNQSRYEQDMSNLQMECSQMQDYREKKRLVTELYLKKMLYRCFISWGNLALCVSEDDEERSHMISGFQSEQKMIMSQYDEDSDGECASVQGQ